jgi:restriction system protein
MAASKRRKPGDTTARLESQAAAAWAKENARIAAVEAKEKAKQDEKAAREREVAAGHAEAEAITQALQARLTELGTLLASTLGEDPYLPFERLKEPTPQARFQPPPQLAEPAPAPELDTFLPPPPSGLGALAPGRKRAHAEAVAQRRAAYEQAVAAHARAEQERLGQLARARASYERDLAGDRERVRRQHAAIDQMASDFAGGKREAVAGYFAEVLAVQSYPGDFPTGVKVAYKPVTQEIVVDIDLPLLDAVPELALCEYLPGKKELRYKKLIAADRNRRYQMVIAQMTLRTLRCVFRADRGGLVATVACNGYVDIINRATGKPAHECLVSIAVDRDLFDSLDLAQVDPLDCLAYLHAKISRTPEKYQPVQPIIDYPWDDLPYADELDATAGLDSVKNLIELDGYEFEDLILLLFRSIPEFDDVRKTRSRSDGGIDIVAVNKKEFTGGRVAIQAKCYAPHHKVAIAEVREMVGSISQREFHKGIIITTSGYTSAARDEASRLGIELYDGERLLWLLRHHLHREYTIIDTDRRRPPIRNLPNASKPS